MLGMCSKGYMQTSFKNKINPRYLIYLIHPEGLNNIYVYSTTKAIENLKTFRKRTTKTPIISSEPNDIPDQSSPKAAPPRSSHTPSSLAQSLSNSEHLRGFKSPTFPVISGDESLSQRRSSGRPWDLVAASLSLQDQRFHTPRFCAVSGIAVRNGSAGESLSVIMMNM